MLNRAVVSSIFAMVFVSSAASSVAPAQEMHKPAALSDHIDVTGTDGTTVKLMAADLKLMPHKTVTVFNAHSKKEETYNGVLLSDLLVKVHAPLGETLKGKLFMTGVVAEGTDGYKALYSIAEVDPAMHTGDVIVADGVVGAVGDMANATSLGSSGAFQLITTEDKRPARWVRNLDGITVLAIAGK